MKRTNTSIPDRIYRKWKQWIATSEIDATMEEWMCWLFENLPEMPRDLKQDTELLDILANNRSNLQFKMPDHKKLLTLIAKGLLEPTEDEQALVLKVKKKK